MPRPTLPVDGESPYGTKLRTAINAISDRADDAFTAAGTASSDAAAATTAATNATNAANAATSAANAAVTFVDLDKYIQSGDASISPAIVRALTAAKTFGVKVIKAKSNAYNMHVGVNFGGANGITFSGAGKYNTVFTCTSTSTVNQMFYTTEATTGLTFEGFSLVGDTVDDAVNPRRSRTYTNSGTTGGFFTGIGIYGDKAINGSFQVQRDITIRDVKIINGRGLPIWLSGIRGTAKMQNTDSYNTMDFGFTWNEKLVVENCTSERSCDNGFSISRGNESVVASNLRTFNCAYWGQWFSGFEQSGTDGDKGPLNVTACNLHTVTAGYGGVVLDDAPKNVEITGVYVRDARLGPTDQPTNIRGVALYIGGYPSSNRTTPTDFATNVTVSNIVGIECARGGIAVTGAKNVAIYNATFIDCGSNFRADGTTAVVATDQDYNFGIAGIANTTITNLIVDGLTCIDTRGIGNFPWVFTNMVTPSYDNLFQQGYRSVTGIVHSNRPFTTSGVITSSAVNFWTASNKFTGGAVAGSSAGTGSLLGFDFNGAAGSIRLHKFQTAGVDRWMIGTEGTAESGSDAGSDFVLYGRTDAGATKNTLARFTRNGVITLGVAGQNIVFTGTPSGITKTHVGLGNVDNTADTAKPVSTAQQTALNLKANLDSPAITGTPTVPTAAAGTNTTQAANTAFVSTAIAAIVASSPAALDTLNELAAALGNDANFSTTVTNNLATKAPLASPTFTGTPAVPTAAAGTSTTQAASTSFVQTAINTGRTVTAAATMIATDGVIVFNSASAISQALVAVASATPYKLYTLVNINTGVVTLTDTISGTANRTLSQWSSLTVMSNGTVWMIV